MSPVARSAKNGEAPAKNGLRAPEDVPVGDLVPYPGNARVHNLAAIKESLEINGQYRPLVAQVATRHVLVGNGTLEAAQALGWATVAVSWLDCDDAAARRIVLADNRASDLASYDEAALVALLQPLETDLAGTGFSVDDFEDLMAALGTGTLPPEPTGAEYSEPRAETERRRNTGTPLAAEGFKEVILVLKAEEYDQLQADVAALREMWGTDSTTATVVRALGQCRSS
jgi:ParB-like chromosome segregation protein Spo0J